MSPTTARRPPASRARTAAAVSASIASTRTVRGTPATWPSSSSSSAAVARWWAIESATAGAGRAVGDALRQALGDAGVADGPRRLGQRLVGGLAHRVAAELPQVAAHLEQAELVELADGRAAERLVHGRGELLQVRDRAGAAQRRRVLDHLALGHRQLVEAGADQRAQRVGQLAGADAGQPGELLQEQRVAAAAVVQLVEEAIVGVAPGEQAAGQLVGLLVRQRLERERQDRDAVAVRRPVQVAARTHRRDERERVAGEGVDEVVEQLDQAGVGPVQVVDRQHRGLALAQALQRLGDAPVDRGAGTRRVEVVDLGRVAVDVGEDLGDPRGLDRIGGRRHLRGTRRDLDAQLVAGQHRVDLEALGERQGDGPVRAGLAVGDAVAVEEDHVVVEARGDAFEHLGDQAALADAVLAGDRDDDGVPAGDGVVDGDLGDGQLGGATDHRHLGAVPAAHPGRGGGGDGHPRLDRPLATAGDEVAGGLVVDRVGGERERRLADDHPARRGHRLQPGRGVDDVAHRRVLGAGQRPDEHLAGVDPDAHADVDATVGGRAGHRAGQRLLHLQPGAHRPLGIVLVGHRCAEQGEDPVTEQLVDPTAVLGDVVDQPGEAALDEPLGLLRVHELGERGEPDEIGEQHRDDAPLLVRAAR